MILRMTAIIRWFPIWALAVSTLVWWKPELFIDWKPAILPLLALIMFMMGLTLTAADFRRVASMPLLVLIGVSLQFGLMPLLAWLVANSLMLDPMLAAGLILVGTCSGGTASNVMTYLAGGDVALSITLTAVSTCLGVLLTPWLSWLYIDASISVPVWSMLQTILILVIAPVIAGMLANHFLSGWVRPIQSVCPLLAMLAIIMIIAIIVALNQSRMTAISVVLITAVIAHNLSGLLLGYLIAKRLGYSSKIARTLAIEVGMQNSGLAVALALNNFAAIAALPGAVFSIWHNISGSILATWWQSIDRKDRHDNRT